MESRESNKDISESQGTLKDNDKSSLNDERIARINFHCSSCQLREMVHYFGTQPPFVYGVEFCEPTFVMRDPFQAPISTWKSKAEYFVAVGANCRICNSIVCKDNECSFYYRGTYCLPCTKKCATDFPLDIQQKLKKLT